MPAPRERTRVAVLGATGAVGQRFVQLLVDHPWFEIGALMASERSAGRPYGEAVRWVVPGAVPEAARRLEVLPAEPELTDAELVFSGLDATAANELEPRFRAAGRLVVSNAGSYRHDPEVPLLIPEINADHLAMVEAQRRRYGGAIVTNPNCSTIGLCLSLEPLRRAFGLRRVTVTTMQALSGAGYPGVSALDVLDNVLPEIAGEEAKLESEPGKIFGRLEAGRVEPASLGISAQCNRVPVRDGHLLSVSVELEEKASPERVEEAFAAYRSPLAGRGLPSAPSRPVVVVGGFARPQPLTDRGAAGGMAISVGRVRQCAVLDARYVALVHNTIRGAAGGTILIAELLLSLRFPPSRHDPGGS